MTEEVLFKLKMLIFRSLTLLNSEILYPKLPKRISTSIPQPMKLCATSSILIAYEIDLLSNFTKKNKFSVAKED